MPDPRPQQAEATNIAAAIECAAADLALAEEPSGFAAALEAGGPPVAGSSPAAGSSDE